MIVWPRSHRVVARNGDVEKNAMRVTAAPPRTGRACLDHSVVADGVCLMTLLLCCQPPGLKSVDCRQRRRTQQGKKLQGTSVPPRPCCVLVIILTSADGRRRHRKQQERPLQGTLVVPGPCRVVVILLVPANGKHK